MLHSVCCCCVQKCLAVPGRRLFFFWKEQRAAVPRVCRHRAFDSASAFSAPLLFAVFVWCYFSRKRQTPLSSGSAVLLRAIHACCRAHRVKHNKGRPLFTSGTNHPDGTSINPPPCRQWLECTYVWPWTIQMRQRQIEWGCTEAIFSLARWPVSCSRLLSPPHLLLVMCQQLGWVSQLYLLGALSCRPTFVPPQTDVLPTLTCLLEDPATHSSAPLRFFFFVFFFPFHRGSPLRILREASARASSQSSDFFIPLFLEGDQIQTRGVVPLHHHSTHRSLLLQLFNINSLQISLSRWFIFTNNTQGRIPTELPIHTPLLSV